MGSSSCAVDSQYMGIGQEYLSLTHHVHARDNLPLLVTAVWCDATLHLT